MTAPRLKMIGSKLNNSIRAKAGELRFSTIEREAFRMSFCPTLYKTKSFQNLSFLQKIGKNA
jgi:hypothetical protein